MSLNIGDNFSYLGAKPLDNRLKYNLLADMKAMADSVLYDGCLAYCVETDKTYQWKSTNEVDTTLGKWREFETGGDAETTKDITSNTEIGGITSNTTIPEGTSITSFIEKLLIKEIAPTITFSASGSGVKEKNTTVTPTLTLSITDKGTATPVAIKFYNGDTEVSSQTYEEGTNSYSFTLAAAIGTDTTVKGVLEYTKSDATAASLEKTASYTFVGASYYGAVAAAPTTDVEVKTLTKNVKNTKAQTATFNLANQRSCYAYPAAFGNLTSIKDANNFEYLGSYTKTTLTIDEESYNVYTLTDPVTATGFKQVYA